MPTWATLEKNFAKLSAKPVEMMFLAGVVALLIAFIRFRKVELNARIMAHIGVMLALATVLKLFRIYHLPQGGSVTLGSMIPILLLAWFYGPEVGLLAGFLFGMISLILGPYILHPVQVLFDYPLPFMALGLIGYFRSKPIFVGAAVALFGRFLCHFISGVAFFGSYAPAGMSPYAYSLMVNGIFMGVEGTLCLALLAFLPIKRIGGVFRSGSSYTGKLS